MDASTIRRMIRVRIELLYCAVHMAELKLHVLFEVVSVYIVYNGIVYARDVARRGGSTGDFFSTRLHCDMTCLKGTWGSCFKNRNSFGVIGPRLAGGCVESQTNA